MFEQTSGAEVQPGHLPVLPDTVVLTWSIRLAENRLQITMYNGYTSACGESWQWQLECQGLWRWSVEYRYVASDGSVTWEPLPTPSARSRGIPTREECAAQCSEIYHGRWRSILLDAATANRANERVVQLTRLLGLELDPQASGD